MTQVAAVRATVTADRLRLRTLVDLVRADSREARRDSHAGMFTLRHSMEAWTAAKTQKPEEHLQKGSLVYERFAEAFGTGKAMRLVSASGTAKWTRQLGVSKNARTRHVWHMHGLWLWAAKPQS